jgi:hypothetical protein
MNRFALVGAALAILVCAAVALAASPSPSASRYASPMASPGASAAPSASPGASPSTAPTTAPTTAPSPNTNAGTANQNAPVMTWTSDVNPVNIEGTATVTKNTDGTGLLVLQLTGMVNEENWTVTVHPGSIENPYYAVDIAVKQGSEVQKIAPDKIQVHLTAAEMDAFTHALARNPGGVTIFASDGHRLSAATVTATQP